MGHVINPCEKQFCGLIVTWWYVLGIPVDLGWISLFFLCSSVIVDVFLIVSVWCCSECKNRVANRQCLCQIVMRKTATCASNGLRPSSRGSLWIVFAVSLCVLVKTWTLIVVDPRTPLSSLYSLTRSTVLIPFYASRARCLLGNLVQVQKTLSGGWEFDWDGCLCSGNEWFVADFDWNAGEFCPSAGGEWSVMTFSLSLSLSALVRYTADASKSELPSTQKGIGYGVGATKSL